MVNYKLCLICELVYTRLFAGSMRTSYFHLTCHSFLVLSKLSDQITTLTYLVLLSHVCFTLNSLIHKRIFKRLSQHILLDPNKTHCYQLNM